MVGIGFFLFLPLRSSTRAKGGPRWVNLGPFLKGKAKPTYSTCVINGQSIQKPGLDVKRLSVYLIPVAPKVRRGTPGQRTNTCRRTAPDAENDTPCNRRKPTSGHPRSPRPQRTRQGCLGHKQGSQRWSCQRSWNRSHDQGSRGRIQPAAEARVRGSHEDHCQDAGTRSQQTRPPRSEANGSPTRSHRRRFCSRGLRLGNFSHLHPLGGPRPPPRPSLHRPRCGGLFL